MKSLDHIAITVLDLERSIVWYSKVLGLQKLQVDSWGSSPIFMTSEDKTGIALFPSPNGNPLPMPKDQITMRPHIAFKVEPYQEFSAMQSHLKDLGISFVFQDHDISHSIYFRDPDDYCVEVTSYDCG